MEAALASGRSLSDVETFIVGTQFAAGDVNGTAQAVNAAYGEILGRQVDAAGLAGAEALLFSSGLADPVAQLRQDLAFSDEGAAAVNALYEDVLGREADPSGLEYGQTVRNLALEIVDARRVVRQQNGWSSRPGRRGEITDGAR